MVKKHQNSPPSSVSFFARCTIRSLFVVLGALLFVVTNHYYNAETVFKLVDFKITNKEAPKDVQITNQDAPIDEDAPKDVQTKKNQDAPVDEEAPKDVQTANQDAPVDEEVPKDVQITNQDAPVDEEAPKDVQIANQDAPVDEEVPKDVLITKQDVPVDKEATKDVQITNQDVPVGEEATKDVQITNQDAPVDEEAPTHILVANQPKDVRVTNKQNPDIVQITNQDAPDDVQITNKEALVDVESPKNTNKEVSVDIQTAESKEPLDVQKTDKEALVDVQTTNEEAAVDIEKVPAHDDALAGCDLFKGKWVYDNVSYPLYKDRDCKFMFGDLACESYGRKDLEYQHWRWQPNGCDLPRFDGKKLLERLRNKRLLIVGDSLNRNLWVSLICMIDSFVPDEASKHMKLTTSLYTFKVTEYNASIDYYWSPLLVESGHDNASNHQFTDIKVRINSIEKHAKIWNDADILVFNSYRWWRVPTVKIFQDNSFESPEAAYKVVKMLRGYKMSLKTWSDWLLSNVDRTKTKMFFVNMAGSHERATNWGKPAGENCLTETRPIAKEGYSGSGSDPAMMRIAENAVEKIKQRGMDMTFLNITQLTEYRRDAHPSIYKKRYHPLSEEQKSNPRLYADCTHWCLPGVPDVWNELLYAHIFR